MSALVGEECFKQSSNCLSNATIFAKQYLNFPDISCNRLHFYGQAHGMWSADVDSRRIHASTNCVAAARLEFCAGGKCPQQEIRTILFESEFESSESRRDRTNGRWTAVVCFMTAGCELVVSTLSERFIREK
jgi:hypothetical protein